MQPDSLHALPASARLRGFLTRLFSSLSTRLLLTCVVALAVSLVSVATAIVFLFEHFPNETLGRHSELKTAEKLAAAVRFDAAGRPASVAVPPELQVLFSSFSAEYGYRIVDAHGQTILLSGPSTGPFSDPGERFQPRSGRQRAVRDNKVFHVATAAVQGPQSDHGDDYYAQITASEPFDAMLIHDRLASVPDVVKVTFLLAVLMFGFTMRVTLRSMLQPLRNISRAAADISPRNLAARLSVERIPSELRPLINAFNDALARLEQGYQAQQTFLAAAAHELQTPLALIRGQIEMHEGLDGRNRLLQDVDLMARQVRQLLHLTELSESHNYAFASVDVASVIDDVVQYLGRLTVARGVGVDVQIGSPAPQVRADKSALFILLKNLLENAVSVSPAGTVVTLYATTDLISVRDEGPGIDPAFIPFIFERFWRAPTARYEGAGLGLAICKEIATAHDWTLSVHRRTPGTCFVLSFTTPEAMA